MRELFTMGDLRTAGVSRQQVRTGERHGMWSRAGHGVYCEGSGTPSRLDGVSLVAADVARRRPIVAEHIVLVGGVPCTDGTLTMVDLAGLVDDLVWEQALESALRKGLTTIEAIEALAPGRRGAARIKRVLALRPPGAPPTGSLLETLTVQLLRPLPDVPEPERQVEIHNRHGDFVAIVDFAWRWPGYFTELDGQQHKDQPVYDARRQTAVTAATGWPCGRFTWHEIVHLPNATARRFSETFATLSGGRRG